MNFRTVTFQIRHFSVSKQLRIYLHYLPSSRVQSVLLPRQIFVASYLKAKSAKLSDACTLSSAHYVAVWFCTLDYFIISEAVFLCMTPVAHCVDVTKFKLPALRNISCYLSSHEHFMAKGRLMIEWNRLNNVDIVRRSVVLADMVSAQFWHSVWTAWLHFALLIDASSWSSVVGSEHFTSAGVQNLYF